VLAGRDQLLQLWRTSLSEVPAGGRVRAHDIVLTGPRGVGKTATVSAFADLSTDYEVVGLQAAAGNVGLVESLLNVARARIEAGSGPWGRAKRAFERISGASLTVAGTGAAITTRERATPPAASPEELARALADLASEVRRDTPNAGVLITLDEMQVAAAPDLALLAAALHQLNVQHPDAPVLFAATGLPHTPDVLRTAGVTHPDRLFDVHTLPLLLLEDDARFAIVEPARMAAVTWMPEAADLIVAATNGYPAHLQVFADHAWHAAAGPDHITVADAQAALGSAGAEIERRTFGPRFERLTARQLEFLTALAAYGGRAATASIATALGKARASISDTRDALITEGDVFAPRWGELALTVPLFGGYLLAHYDEARERATTQLLSLEELRRGATGAASPSRRTDAIGPGEALRQPPRHLPRGPEDPGLSR
jgi:hypothetical protein